MTMLEQMRLPASLREQADFLGRLGEAKFGSRRLEDTQSPSQTIEGEKIEEDVDGLGRR